MIQLDDATQPLLHDLIKAPGGFAWWYLEVLDDARSGLVMIWSFGLPFLPGYMSLTRSGRQELPEDRPSLNVAVYEEGRLIYYVLHEFEPDDVTWDGAGHWRFGQTEITQRDEDGTRYVDVDLDCPVHAMGAPLRGRVRVAGPIPKINGEPVEMGQQQHLWTPAAVPAFATALLDLSGTRRFSVAGHAYHDRNGSPHALDALGIGTWVWGHASVHGQERIFYILWPGDAELGVGQCVGFEVDAQGNIEARKDLRVRMVRYRRTFYGMPTWDAVELITPDGELWFRAALRDPVDDGPFYLRYICDVAAQQGQDRTTCVGSLEVIVPSRIDLAVHRPLVRMRVATDTRKNSFWLPLFQGRLDDRFARMWGHIRAAGGQ